MTPSATARARNRTSRAGLPPSHAAAAPKRDFTSLTAADVERLVHDLEVHQAELRAQNEELREAQFQLAQSRDRLADLYDFAPVGHFTFDAQATIREINLAGAALIGLPRSDLPGCKFTRWLAAESQDTFYLHCQAVFSSRRKQTCELLLRRADRSTFPVQAQTIRAVDPATLTPCLRTAITDIGERKRLETELRQANARLERRVKERTAELTRSNRQLCRQTKAQARLQQELLAVSENEQRRLGADVHDGICAQLAALRFLNDALYKKLLRTPSPAAAQSARMGRLLADTLTEARDLALMLNPVEVEAEGLMTALANLAARTQELYKLPVHFTCRQVVLVPDHSVANHLFRITQEAIRNALTHAKPSCITVALDQKDGILRLVVANDGRPLPKRLDQQKGMGLRNLHYRASLIGARLELRPGRHGGALLACTWPMKQNQSSTPFVALPLANSQNLPDRDLVLPAGRHRVSQPRRPRYAARHGANGRYS